MFLTNVLYADLRVLSEFQQIESFSAFNSIYNHTGIFGIHATTVRYSILDMDPHMVIYMSL